MKNHWRLIYSFLPKKLERKKYELFFKEEHELWIENGKTLPVSHLSKQEYLKNLAKKYNTKTVIETGTYMGDMMFAMLPYFKKLYSIELSDFFYKKAVNRFKNEGSITILFGDSASKLEEVVNQLNEPALFWLDGHYSGGITAKGAKECPVFEELALIFKSTYNHVIVIDDARLFIGQNDYPTINELTTYIYKNKPNYEIDLVNDNITLTPKEI